MNKEYKSIKGCLKLLDNFRCKRRCIRPCRRSNKRTCKDNFIAHRSHRCTRARRVLLTDLRTFRQQVEAAWSRGRGKEGKNGGRSRTAGHFVECPGVSDEHQAGSTGTPIEHRLASSSLTGWLVG
ncbi:uncharacterized protein LOC117234364 [Bombus vosnesenskii]|uniref:Uncharacterized protein LOC117234364 n=2 Tax=Pyrobombus TaxID=144703 RepID=A0A6J3KDX9_9HYME|nr:uncharacterized protein LOC117214576 [Bombus bifarius]XP_033351378.1 uncharacterized protein LOC117234364 [Bombus vosnesenskii]